MINKQRVIRFIEAIKNDKRMSSSDHEVIDYLLNVMRQQLTNGWIPCNDRLPTREEYLKDDGRFIVTDGMRRYQGIFNPYDNRFDRETHDGTLLREDPCVIAWQPLPEKYIESN